MTYLARWLVMMNPELFCVLDLLATSPSAMFSSLIRETGAIALRNFKLTADDGGSVGNFDATGFGMITIASLPTSL